MAFPSTPLQQNGLFPPSLPFSNSSHQSKRRHPESSAILKNLKHRLSRKETVGNASSTDVVGSSDAASSRHAQLQKNKSKPMRRSANPAGVKNVFYYDQIDAPPPPYSPSAKRTLSSAAHFVPSNAQTPADDPYAFLSTFDTIFLIDDSGSKAGSQWRETAEALKAIEPICTSREEDRIPQYLLHCIGSTFDDTVPKQTHKTAEGIISLISTSRVRYDNIARGRLAIYNETALVDTGATNIIAADFLAARGLRYDSSKKRVLTRGDGSHFSTLGSITLPWQFDGDNKAHMIDFNVLPKAFCTYAVTLGGAFMKKTMALANFARKVFRIPRKVSLPRCRFQSTGQLRMDGFCEGRPVSALPDCASDVPLMSLDFARQLGRPIDTSDGCCIILELPGQHYAKTCGLVRDVELSFNGQSYQLDCYVLDGLPGDLLLDEEFLYETDAFGWDTESLFDIDTNDMDTFLIIRRVDESSVSAEHEELRKVDRSISELVDNFRSLDASGLTPTEREVEEDRLNAQLHLLRSERSRLLSLRNSSASRNDSRASRAADAASGDTSIFSGTLQPSTHLAMRADIVKKKSIWPSRWSRRAGISSSV